MPLSHFFIVSSTGDTILSRNLRGEPNKGSSEQFYKVIKEQGNEGTPIFQHDGVIYFFIRRSNLYFVATTLFQMSPSYVLELLQKITNVFKDFCGTLSEESLRQNFILAYEILDEMLNFGYVHCTDNSQLKQKIHNLAVVKKPKVLPRLPGVRVKTRTVPSTVSQRPLTGSAQKSEVFVDVLEKMSVVLSDDQYRSFIEGHIKIKSFLYGSPQIQLALNEDLIINRRVKRSGVPALDFCSFHNSVDLSDFERTRILTLNHNDGEFTVMSYRVSGNIILPFKIKPNLEINNNNVTLSIIITSVLPGTTSAVVNVTCPIPSTSLLSIDNALLPHCPTQTIEYKSEEHLIYWNMQYITGSTEVTLHSKMVFASNVAKKEFGPINLNFEAPLYNASNVKVRYLRILHSPDMGPSYRWVRYVTTSNSYLYRF